MSVVLKALAMLIGVEVPRGGAITDERVGAAALPVMG